MNRWRRLLSHRWMDESDTRRLLPPDAVARLEAQVRASEARHGGEVRLCVEAGLPLGYLWQQLRARDRAITLFGKLRVWDTEANNGVLIYLLLADHAVEIVADRGLSQHVSATQWQGLVDSMREPLRQGRFEDALTLAVAEVDRLLCQHFALAEGAANPNELPDRMVLG